MGTQTKTETYVKAGKTSDFKDGEKKKIIVEGHEIMLARVGNNFYAIANKCPHMGADLSAGRLEGTVITCPRHGSQFDVRDGKNLKWTNWPGAIKALSEVVKSPRPVKTYNVKVEGEDISVEI